MIIATARALEWVSLALLKGMLPAQRVSGVDLEGFFSPIRTNDRLGQDTMC